MTRRLYERNESVVSNIESKDYIAKVMYVGNDRGRRHRCNDDDDIFAKVYSLIRYDIRVL